MSVIRLSLLALAALCLSTAASLAAQPAALPPEGDEFVPAKLPGGSTLTVVLKLAGDPVAVAQAKAPDKQISDADKEAIESDLRAQQDALEPLIEARGGTVLAKFQNAINGIKVSVSDRGLSALATIPGVVEVKPVAIHQLDNIISVPFIGAPAVWAATPGFHGENVKVAIIDTGIDYTHANFAGPGTSAAYDAAFAADTAPANPAYFGPNAPKVKGGIDLVGDDYNASAPAGSPRLIPHPDPNPLDCNGHGSHVAGTVAGFGVTGTTFPTRKTYRGSYDGNTLTSNTFAIGPGVAPLADLYAVRVFGCSGSTNVVVDAIDWAVAHGMQVINMSLGSPFGTADTADAEAATHAEEAGVVVVASAGNSGSAPYITGSPASGKEAISVAAMDSNSPLHLQGAQIALNAGGTVGAQNSNGIPVTNGARLQVIVLRNGNGSVSLGCSESEYTSAIVGKLVVTQRGTCARVDRATFASRHGAAAVAMINNDVGFPPIEGSIPNVTIPFLGVLAADGARLAAASSATVSNGPVTNPLYHHFASFTSAGPRSGDGKLKPDVSAPGVNIVSTAVGSGVGRATLSGTSMAAPHVTGVAALTIQSHPGWTTDELRLAIVNTGDASQIPGFTHRLGGSGLVQPFASTRTSVVARGTDESGNLSFGVVESSRDIDVEGTVRLSNRSPKPQSFEVATAAGAGAPHSASVRPSRVTIEGGRSEAVRVRLRVPAATVGNSDAFRQVSGAVTFSPTAHDGNNGVGLTVPYYLVPRARSVVKAGMDDDFGPAQPSTVVELSNRSRSVAGTADFYAWGLRGHNRKAGIAGIRAVGTQSFTFAGGRNAFIVFAVNTFQRWSNAAANEYDIYIDSNGDGVADYVLFAADAGAVTTGSYSGQMGAFLLNLKTGAARAEPVSAPTDGTTLELGVYASQIKVNPANPRFSYTAIGFDWAGDVDELTTSAVFNPFHNAVSTGDFEVLNPRASASVPLTIDPAEWAKSPALGVMVVGLDNANRPGDEEEEARQAQLLRISPGGEDRDDD